MAPEKDVLFCPYCSLMTFDGATSDAHVYCEMCGIDIPLEELVKAI